MSLKSIVANNDVILDSKLGLKYGSKYPPDGVVGIGFDFFLYKSENFLYVKVSNLKYFLIYST